MMNLVLMALLNSLPPEVAVQLQSMKDSLESKGVAEGVFDVPEAGRCRVVITKLEA